MTNDTVIRVENVSKKYCKELKHTMLYGIQDIARSAIGLSSHSGRLRDGEFLALNDVSFEVKRGESIGIIGANGSGKSTLLKLLNGIFMPDKGRIEIKGKVGALIEVGAGFHPMLTGRENIYVNGSILGMSKKEIDKKFDEIVDFADIGDFIDTPVKHYSSGMYVRLGFAVAISADPDILILDEVLAVGDAAFQRKCFDKVNALKKVGKTIIFVTHDDNSLKVMSSKALLFERGQMLYGGDPNEATLKYMKLLFPEMSETPRRDYNNIVSVMPPEEIASSGHVKYPAVHDRYCLEIVPDATGVSSSFGSGGAWVNWLRIFGLKEPNIFHGGERLEIEISYSWDQDNVKNLAKSKNLDYNLLFGVTFETKKGIILTNLATILIDRKKLNIDPLRESTCVLNYTVQIPWLAEDDYFLSTGIALGSQEYLIPLNKNQNLVHLYCRPKSKYVFGLMNWIFDVNKK